MGLSDVSGHVLSLREFLTVRISLLMIFVAGLLATGCGGGRTSHPHYETTTYRHEAVSRDYRAALVEYAQGVARAGKLYRRDGKGKVRRLKPAHAKKLHLATLRAIHMTSDDKFRGAEVDILVAVKGRGRVPVSVIVDFEGNVTVERAKKAKQMGAGSISSFATRKGSRKWSETEKWNVVVGMARLSAAERKLLDGIPFIRHVRNKDASKGALYLQKNCKAEIRIYDRAFTADKWQFAGSAYRPIPSSSRTVIHEMGHAIHNRPGRLAFCRYEKFGRKVQARIDRYNARLTAARKKRQAGDAAWLKAENKAIDRAKAKLERLSDRALALSREGPVLAAYRKALGDKPAPTVYGESSIQESFAESFSLFRADPTALKRILPRVYRWFAKKGHLAALD